MKKIKFRGLAIEDYKGKPLQDKKFVYGNLWASEDNSYVIIGEKIDNINYNYRVDPDTVKQFVMYDKDGNEVYEDDDILIYPQNTHWQEDNSYIKGKAILNSSAKSIGDSNLNLLNFTSDFVIKKESADNDQI